MVFLEILAASGIFGFLPFILYIGILFVKPMQLVKKLELENQKILTALLFSLLSEIIILQFNQNILRPYFWLHIAILSAYFTISKQKAALKHVCY